jgi:hypothetical protein
MLKIEPPPTVEKIVVQLKRLMDNYSELAPKLSAGAIATARQTFSESAVQAQRHAAKHVLTTPPGRGMRWLRFIA